MPEYMARHVFWSMLFHSIWLLPRDTYRTCYTSAAAGVLSIPLRPIPENQVPGISLVIPRAFALLSPK